MLQKSLSGVALCFILMSQQLAFAATDLKGTLAVVNKTDNTISIIDLSSKKIVNTLATGQGPHELVLSGDQKWAVSTDFVGGNSLTVFDMTQVNMGKTSIARTIPLPNLPGPHGIRFFADNERVIFTSGTAQSLGIANVVSGEVLGQVDTKQTTTHMVALNNDETLAFSTNIRSNSISVINLADATKLKDIATEAMPEAINYRRVANELWYGANQDGLLVVIDPVSEALIAKFDGFSFPYRVLFNHDESIALVPDFRNHYLRFFDAQTKKEIATLELEPEAGPQGIVLHPTEDIAFLSLNLKNKVLAIDIATRKVMAEYPTGNNPDGVVFISSYKE
jgi:DNA-binding beta-propeller fold protein YncE